MKTIFSLLLVSLLSNFAWADSAFVRNQKFPISWIKQSTADSWTFVQGFSGAHKIKVDLVEVKEEVQGGRKLASAEEPVVQYKINSLKKNILSLSEEQLSKNQIMIVITAP